MTKSKGKFKGLIKGVALGFAVVLCSAFFPANAARALAETWDTGNTALENTHRIEVDGMVAANDNSDTVVKGENYTIPVGEYYAGQTMHQIGSTTPSGTISSSKVEVIYKATGDVVKTITNQASVEGVTFEATQIGTYTIRYTVIDNDTEYSYDFDVECEASDATFEFKSNDSSILPSVYDTKLAAKGQDEYKNKDIVLPLPTVNDEDGDAILTSADADRYVTSLEDGSGVPTDGKGFVYISLTKGVVNEEIKILGSNGQYYIEGDTLVANAAALDGTELKITYTYYQTRANGNKTFIASTSQTIKVEDGYYYNTSEENEGDEGYELVASWSTSRPDSAIVGVEKDLPTITATTKSTNSPASESVKVYYELQVLKTDDGNRDVTADVITDDFKFKAKEEGSYRFIYTVKDFYGNTVNTSNTTFTINNVQDTQMANVYMYDAGDYTVDEDGAYSSAENKLATQAVRRNIIMYAIAGSDNMVDADDLVLRREIQDASYVTRFKITEQKYNKYNLIFAPGVSGSEKSMDNIYKQIVSDNFEIYKQMVMDGKSTSEPSVIKQWLLDNDYLLVTTTWNVDPMGSEIVAGSPAEGDQAAIDEMITKGYAFVKPNNTSGNYVFEEQNYTFYYYAADNQHDNQERHIPYSVNLVNSFSDNSIPSITFSSDLQSSYLPGEKITFNVASASDTIDSRIETVTAYRFLKVQDGQKVTTIKDDGTEKTLRYVIRNSSSYNKNDENKWYISDRDPSTGLVESEGWYYDTDASSYTVDLNDAPSDAVYLEILCYAIDDYGNIGFFNKLINIADIADTDAPVLDKVIGAPAVDTSSHDYEAPMTIGLPTLYYSDTSPEYMHANVTVYRIGEDGSRKVMQSTGMSTTFDSYRGVYKVDAGAFNASTEGTYQVVVTVVDSSNHSLSTFFTYKVSGTAIIENPEIDNISSETIEAAVDEPLYLKEPTIAVSESSDYVYIGLDENDDSNTALYYTTTMVSADSSDYVLTKNWFTGMTKGTYKLKYQVFLMRYNKNDLVGSGKGIFLDDNGKLKYRDDGSAEYFVYLEETDGKYDLALNTQLNGKGTKGEVSEIAGLVEKFTPESDIQTIKVGDIGVNVTIDDDAYARTEYATIPDTPNTITIVKPDIQIYGNASIDRENSTVSITCTSGSSTDPLATISLAEWETAIDDDSEDFSVEGSTIKLRLIRNGRYTIKYSIQAQDKNNQPVGDPKTLEYNITNGDVVGPDIDFAENFIKDTYRLGDTLVVNFAGLELSDKVTTDIETLRKNISMRLVNNDTDSSWTIENSTSSGYSYEHELTEAGDYTLTVTARDEAGNRNEKSISFTVSTDRATPANTKEIIGGVLIGLSVAILGGVVIYFIVSKVKLDKREKAYKKSGRDKK